MTEEYDSVEPIDVDEMDDAERMPFPVATSAAAVPKCEDKFSSWIMARDSASSPTLQAMLSEDALKLENWKKPDIGEKPIVIPPGNIACPGNVAFKCPIGYHPLGVKCSQGPRYWKEIWAALTKHSFDLARKQPSLQKLMEKLIWQVSESVGIAEILSSPKAKVVKLEKYQINEGPTCKACNRRVSMLANVIAATCCDCTHRITTVYRDVTDYNFQNDLPTDDFKPRREKTLVFLCARQDPDGTEAINHQDHFEKLRIRVQETYSNPGPFGDGNQPGYPKGIQLVGKFASISSGRVPLSAMNIATLNQPKDVLTLNMLTDAIINAYRPGDIILIAMSQPASLCTGHQDLEQFIRELFERGIPQSGLYFHCRGLRSLDGATEAYETNVLAADVRNAILNNMPRYGMRPAVSAYLYACDLDDRYLFPTVPRATLYQCVNQRGNTGDSPIEFPVALNDHQPAKRRRLLVSASSSSLEMPRPPSAASTGGVFV